MFCILYLLYLYMFCRLYYMYLLYYIINIKIKIMENISITNSVLINDNYK